MSTKQPEESQAVAYKPEQIPETIQPEPDSDSSEETLADETPEEEVPEDVPVSPVKKVKRKYTRRVPKETIKTSDENVEVILKTRKKGPTKRVVTVYKEDIPVEPIQIVERAKRKPGRPKKPVVEVVKEPDEEDVIVFQKPTKVVKMTAKELKQMELETRLLELQAVSGNANLKMNKSGKVDGRQRRSEPKNKLRLQIV